MVLSVYSITQDRLEAKTATGSYDLVACVPLGLSSSDSCCEGRPQMCLETVCLPYGPGNVSSVFKVRM